MVFSISVLSPVQYQTLTLLSFLVSFHQRPLSLSQINKQIITNPQSLRKKKKTLE